MSSERSKSADVNRKRQRTTKGNARVRETPPPSTQLPRVALLIESSTLFGRRVLLGIAQYLRETRPWVLHVTDRSTNDGMPPWIKSSKIDGIITRIITPEIRDVIKESNIPVVDLNEQLGDMGIHLISNDHAAIGRMAAGHLLDRGFRQFAFLGYSGHRWNDVRRDAFIQAVGARGYPCAVYPDRPISVHKFREFDWLTELDSIAEWVAVLGKPVGIMTCADYRGVQLLSACHQAQVAVPEQAAVVAVGADDVACQFANPPLSSVMLNAWKMGYEAASLLDRLMQGEAVEQSEVLVPPIDIFVRRSSDITAVNDPLVAGAMHFMRENARKGIKIESVLKHLGVSRTTLQNRFRAYMNRSIHDVLIEMKLSYVKEMLIETPLSIAEISVRCGFLNPEYMSTSLKRYTGWSPARYRQQHGRNLHDFRDAPHSY